MRKSVKTFLIICNAVFFFIAAIWLYKSNFQYEPMIVLGQSLVTLVTLLIGDTVAKNLEISRIRKSNLKINKDAKARMEDVDESEITIN